MTEQRESGVVCPNCSAPVIGPWCAQCGQRHGQVRASLRRILADALEDQFSVNAALPRTIKALLIHPGELTREYLNQRIARYIPPVRLYLISSVIFFLLLSFFSSTDRIHFGPSGGASGDTTAVAAASPDSSGAADTVEVRGSVPVAADLDSAVADSAAGNGPGFGVKIDMDGSDGPVEVNLGNERLNQYFERRIEALKQMPQDQMLRELAQGFFEQAPKVMFILLPFYALLLKILYFRRYYVEHFIFALHVHAFTFAIFTIVLLLPDSIPYISGLLLAWIPVYTLVAMKRVYAQGIARTLFKWWSLGVSYFVLVLFGVVGALLAVLATV